MGQNLEEKLAYVEAYLRGEKIIIPDGLNPDSFMRNVRFWKDCYKMHGLDGLRDHPKMHQWSYEQKLECIMKIAAGSTFIDVGVYYCVNPDQIREYYKRYQKFGKIGLDKYKFIYKTKVRPMTKNIKKKESEMTLTERVKMLEERNLRLEAENVYLKKLKALTEKKQATTVKATKQK